MFRWITIIACTATATAAAAEPVRLSNAAIKSTLAGSLLEIDTPAGAKIPVRFSKDGLVSGEAGILASYLGAAHDRGRWWAANDRLCVKWFRWFDAETRCVDLRQEGDRMWWQAADGRQGTALIAERAKVAEPVTAPAYALAAAKSVEATASTQDSVGVDPPINNFVAAGMPPLMGEAKFAVLFPLASAPPATEPVVSGQTSGPNPHPAPASQARSAKSHPEMSGVAAATSSSPLMRASFRVADVDYDDTLNIRSGPSENFSPIGRLQPQERGVRIIGPCRGDWCPIQHGAVSGWVNRYYLAEENSGSDR